MITINEDYNQRAKIKVIGVGGGGCNAINRMINEKNKIPGVEFVAINTDSQVLTTSMADIKIQIGKEKTKGLGAGAKPELGKNAATENLQEIKEHIEGTDMVFIAAGMGGGTGTGASPVIAALAKEMGILTVGIVTTPFDWEGAVRKKNSTEGISELKKVTDTLITIANQKLLSILPKNAKINEGFVEADKILRDAAMGISGLIQKTGVINLDFADVNTIMSNAGKAHIGIGLGEGESRAEKAVSAAVHSDLLDNVSIKGAKGVIVHIIAGNDFEFGEMDTIMSRVYSEIGEDSQDSNIINGLIIDENYEGKIQVLLIATNLATESTKMFDPIKETQKFVTEKSQTITESKKEVIRDLRSDIKDELFGNFNDKDGFDESSFEENLPNNFFSYEKGKDEYELDEIVRPRSTRLSNPDLESISKDSIEYPPFLKKPQMKIVNNPQGDIEEDNGNIFNLLHLESSNKKIDKKFINQVCKDSVEYPPFLRESMD